MMKMKKKIIIIAVLFLTALSSYAQVGSYAGAFARMGFGARGLSMGNALVSDAFGEVSGYYNPSLSVFQKDGLINLGYTFMSFDRKLNFVSFNKQFVLSEGKQTAGVTLSWINAGVTDIDGRDNDARSLGMLSTYENQFALGFGFLVSPQVALGIGFKLYHSKLYDEVTSTNVGFDAGVTYLASKELSFGLSVRDIASKYVWETSDVYGSVNGKITEDKFPTLADLGASYLLPEELGIVSLGVGAYFNPKFETVDTLGVVTKSDAEINFGVKFGGEINVNKYVKFRAGVERIDFTADDFMGNIKPGAGINISKSFSDNWTLGVDYSFQFEPFSHRPVQILGITFKFR
jgi:hypothetical protein